MLLDRVKVACRVTSTAYDTELLDLLESAFADIGITDVKPELLTDNAPALIQRAVITYVKMNFGYLDTDVYNRLKASYDEQKQQLLMSSEYTEWGESDA